MIYINYSAYVSKNLSWMKSYSSNNSYMVWVVQWFLTVGVKDGIQNFA